MNKSVGLSLRSFAKRHQVDEKAIRKAVEAGRLAKSVGKRANGRPCIVDVELADAEWNVNRAQPPKADIIDAKTLTEAQRLATIERGRKLQLENDKTEGRLVDVAAASREAFDAAAMIRKAILNVPARISAELVGITDEGRMYTRLDAALREALISMADQLEKAVEGH